MHAVKSTVAAAGVSLAVALAGCGGSNNKPKASSASNPTSSNATASSSTPTSSAPPTSSTAGRVSKRARVASATYYMFALAVTHDTAPYLNTDQARFAAHCIQDRFLAAGYKTQADVENATRTHGQKLRDILSTCFLNGRYH